MPPFHQNIAANRSVSGHWHQWESLPSLYPHCTSKVQRPGASKANWLNHLTHCSVGTADAAQQSFSANLLWLSLKFKSFWPCLLSSFILNRENCSMGWNLIPTIQPRAWLLKSSVLKTTQGRVQPRSGGQLQKFCQPRTNAIVIINCNAFTRTRRKNSNHIDSITIYEGRQHGYQWSV